MGYIPVATHSSNTVGKQMGPPVVYTTSVSRVVHLYYVGDTMRAYQEPTNKFKRLVKYAAIGLATAYVAATGCETYQSWGPPTIEINMEHVKPDGTFSKYDTIDTLCFKQEKGLPFLDK